MKILIEITYLVSSILFIFGIKKLSSPKTARQGNFLSALGMFLAVVVTLLDQHVLTYEWIIIGVVVGSAIGTIMAVKVEMTGMPQMVGILNGFGGGASTFVALSEYYKIVNYPQYSHELLTTITIVLSILIGSVTFTGSFIAFGKLQGFVTGKVVKYTGQHLINGILVLAVIVLGVYVVLNPDLPTLMLGITAVALVLGVLLVLPIGGADMPVAVSLLNSYSGIAAAATGFDI